MTDAYIYDTVRTPRGKGKKDGSLHEVTSLALSARVLNELRERNNLDTKEVEDVIWGCVTPVGEQGGDIARGAVLYAGWDDSVPGLQVNRFCASGLEAFNLAANQVRGGAGDLYVAGGVEMMSRVPMGSDGYAAGVDPQGRHRHLFRASGHRRGCDRHPLGVLARRRGRLRGREPEARGQGLGGTPF